MALLHYNVVGQGPVLVLLHGFLCSSLMWKKVMPFLKKDHRLILIDLPGHGRSNGINANTIEKMADMALNTITDLGIKDFSILGHSMGGYVAMEMAYKDVDRIQKLILLNSTPFADSKEKKMNRDRAIKAVQNTHQLFVRQFIPGLFLKENIESCKNEIIDLQDEATKVSSEMIINGLQAMRDRREHLTYIIDKGMDVNIILGLEDPVIDPSLLLERLQGENSVKVNVIKGSGHMSFYEKPEICFKLIKGALL